MNDPLRHSISDTAAATNLKIHVVDVVTLDEMEAVVASAADGLGLEFSKVTTLGAQRYRGNRHWHLKRDLRAKGCLDVTYWPDGAVLWVTIRNSEPTWVREAGRALHTEIEIRLRTDA